jgi:hypothetical protein
MNAKEIRIGNIFLIDGEQFEIDGHKLYDLCACTTCSDLIDGLPITPQLLLSHSFKQATDNIWYDFQDGSYLELREVKDGWHVTIGDSPEMSCDEEQRIGITTIQFFHQLQNLIYDMKGIEI